MFFFSFSCIKTLLVLLSVIAYVRCWQAAVPSTWLAVAVVVAATQNLSATVFLTVEGFERDVMSHLNS